MIVAYGLCGALILVGAAWVVTLSNLFRAALSLGLVLLGVAALFIVLEAEFLALVQILVYVGAILTLVVFAIMLTAKLQGSTEAASSRQRLPAAAASLGLFVVLASATQGAVVAGPSGASVSVSAIGRELVTTMVLPFEVVSLVFVAAMVGAIVLASPKGHRPPLR